MGKIANFFSTVIVHPIWFAGPIYCRDESLCDYSLQEGPLSTFPLVVDRQLLSTEGSSTLSWTVFPIHIASLREIHYKMGQVLLNLTAFSD